MWIASKIGFFSLVVKDGCLHVRGRLKRDLETLATLLGVPHHQIERWPNADYRWRIRLDPTKASHVLAALGTTVDYPNFKSAIAATPGQAEKLRAYHDLWHGLFELQDRPSASTAAAQPARR